jgi:V8-like Glu-specific endopeptidase
MENPERSATGYWTPERFREAKPMPQPANRPGAAEQPQLPQEQEDIGNTSVFESGYGPTVYVRPDRFNRLFTPAEPNAAMTEEKTGEAQDPTVPLDNGTANALYSSQPLIPRSAVTSDPYRRAGKLFGTIPGVGDFTCTASVIKPRLIVTAGHCVHSGSGGSGGFFTNFVFVPAFDNGTAPYGSWTWASMTVTTTWSNGGGSFPNAADYAIIELRDLVVNGSLRRIGDVVGSLGYRTAGLFPNHVHMLGYPSNLDNGERMRQVTAQSFQATTSNTVEYGTNAGTGSSGGPWIQNFAGDCTGTNCGANSVANAIVGVTSYGSSSTSPKYAGASIFDSRFPEILNIACTRQAENC